MKKEIKFIAEGKEELIVVPDGSIYALETHFNRKKKNPRFQLVLCISGAFTSRYSTINVLYEADNPNDISLLICIISDQLDEGKTKFDIDDLLESCLCSEE